MRWLASLIVLFTLAGCGLARQAQIRQEIDVANVQHASAKASCEQQFPSETQKPVTPGLKCFKAADDARNGTIQRLKGNAHLDVIEAHYARALLAAERYDRGEISEAEYRVAVAESKAGANGQLFDRRNRTSAVAAQQRAAAAASQQAATAAGDSIRDAFKPTTTHTNCNAIGNSVNCTTY